MYTKKDTERAINVALKDKLTCSLYLMSNYPKTLEFTLLEGVEEGCGNQATVGKRQATVSYQLPDASFGGRAGNSVQPLLCASSCAESPSL